MEKKYKAKNMKGGFFKRNLYYFLMGGALLTAALVLVLVLTLGGGKPTIPVDILPPPGGGDEEPGQPVVVQPVTFMIPVENGVLSKGYSEYSLAWNPTLKQWETHTALDFTSHNGASVYAAFEGTVESIEDTILDGTVITIAHRDGFKTVYRSLSSEVTVAEGQSVSKGQTIGSISASQMVEKSQGAHLHFEVILDGIEVDPTAYMPDLSDK